MAILDRYDGLKIRSIKMKTRVAQHKSTALDLKSQYDIVSEKLVKEKELMVVQECAINVIKEIIDKLSQEYLTKVADLLTYSLQTIFYDRNYFVEVQVGDKRNAKTVEFFLVEETESEIIRSPFNGGIGGGILAVVGFVLQVYYLGFMNQSSILFCDEALSQVSEQYKGPLFSFIKELSEKKNFIFVLVTHDQSIMSKADRTFMVDTGVVKEISTLHRVSD
jgi:hypothetical protein